MNKVPEIPEKNLINKYLEKIKNNEKYSIGEVLLDKLRQNCVYNNSLEDIWLKVIVINHLYSTSIIDTFKIAKHISGLNNVDEKLSLGDIGLVDEIRKRHGIVSRKGNEIDFYSFATKYCSEHNKNDYPIIDKYVKGMLITYKQKDNFAEFTEEDLKVYKRFVGVIKEFKNKYKLNYTIREIDWFLWAYGKDFLD